MTGRHELISSAIDAALASAAEYGLRGVEPVLRAPDRGSVRILRDRANLLLHLSPAPVVARVATSTALVRPAVATNLARDVSIAGYLADVGAPVVPPSTDVPPGPHTRDGHVLTFWRYVRHEPDHRFRPAEFADLLADLHGVLRGYPGELPALPPLDIAGHLKLLAEQVATEDLADLAAEADRLVTRLAAEGGPVQPLHGDAHPGNVLYTPDGPLWNDFEDAWCGPIQWDLACLARTRRLDGIAALADYPGAPTVADLGTCFAARRLQGVLWTVLMAELFPDSVPAGSPDAAGRLAHWRATRV